MLQRFWQKNPYGIKTMYNMYQCSTKTQWRNNLIKKAITCEILVFCTHIFTHVFNLVIEQKKLTIMKYVNLFHGNKYELQKLLNES